METELQPMLFRAMADPAFYPHKVEGPVQIETHISKVFLTGPYAYKIKKPVDLGFLDFSSLERRRLFCEQEVLLNQRLTNDVYLGVVPIGYNGRRFQIGCTEAVEYAVKMRQLPTALTLRNLLTAGRISSDDLERLAARLAGFHKTARHVLDSTGRSHTQAACTENFRQIMPHTGKMLDAGRYDFIRAATFNFFIRNKHLIDKRIACGHFRDGHGDLRTEHVYFTEDGHIQVLDCIEFNEHLRVVDTASDLAFLIMDLEFQRRSEAARDLLRAYYRHCDDPGLPALIDFFKCYRAMVRCKVNCIQLASHSLNDRQHKALSADAQCYLHLAYYYARRFSRPTIWVFCGLPGSGKSTLAAGLADLLAIESHNSDQVRKRLQGLAPLAYISAPADQGIYTAEITRKVYDKLYAMARKAICEGCSLILDATYSALSYRDRLRNLADDCGARILFAECRAGDDELLRRLGQRETAPSVSDARPELFGALKTRFEPVTEIPADQYVALDTTKAREQCLRDLLTAAYLEKSEGCFYGQPERRLAVRETKEPIV